jgi:predicted anti-sigma-YlaC factor YlaD
MKCQEIHERMPDVAAGFGQLTADENNHLASCSPCAKQLKEMRATMAVLDEWQAPEPSPYFDVRLQARLREEMAKPQPARWMHWFRRPVLAAALTIIMGVGISVYFTYQPGVSNPKAPIPEGPGTAVSDLQTLENNHEMYADFELLDDLTVQQDVSGNPKD